MGDTGSGRSGVLAVICVTHRAEELLPDFVAALSAASSAASTRLVIVDSGSPDDTLAVARRLAPTADVLSLDANRGYAAGINAGVAHVRATGGAVAYVVANPDVRPEAGAFDLLAAGLHVAGVGVTCPQLHDEDGRRQDSLRRLPSVGAAWSEALLGGPWAERLHLPVEVVRDPAHYATAHRVGWATGGLLAVSDECSRAVGPWAEHLFLYDEEVDFCRRAAGLGYATWYVPQASCVRLEGESRPAPWRQALMRRNRVRIAGAGEPLRGGLTAAALVVGELLRAALGRPEARAGIWAVLHRATPVEIMARYAPGSGVTVSPPGTAPSLATVFVAGEERVT